MEIVIKKSTYRNGSVKWFIPLATFEQLQMPSLGASRDFDSYEKAMEHLVNRYQNSVVETQDFKVEIGGVQ